MALSGGLAQRLMVARAMLHNPAMLFLDEPTAGLDPRAGSGCGRSSGAPREGQTVVLTTHNMEEADQLCDRIGIMDRGSILALDTPEELKRAVGADTIVTVTAEGDLEELAGASSRRSTGSMRRRRWKALCSRGARRRRVFIRVISAAEGAGSPSAMCRSPRPRSRRCSSTSPARSCATDGFDHRPPGRPVRRPARRRALQPGRIRGAAAARPGGAAQEPERVRAPHDRAAAPAVLRLPLRVPDHRHGGWRRAAAGSASRPSRPSLVAGVVGLSIMFQGIQAVALPMVQEFGYTKEIEDRVLAPLPVVLVALEKVVFGALQGLWRR